MLYGFEKITIVTIEDATLLGILHTSIRPTKSQIPLKPKVDNPKYNRSKARTGLQHFPTNLHKDPRHIFKKPSMLVVYKTQTNFPKYIQPSPFFTTHSQNSITRETTTV